MSDIDTKKLNDVVKSLYSNSSHVSSEGDDLTYFPTSTTTTTVTIAGTTINNPTWVHLKLPQVRPVNNITFNYQPGKFITAEEAESLEILEIMLLDPELKAKFEQIQQLRLLVKTVGVEEKKDAGR